MISRSDSAQTVAPGIGTVNGAQQRAAFVAIEIQMRSGRGA
jgi:hypothetical protein